MNKHRVHQLRLENFPIDKSEYYSRLKEAHGINSIREFSRIIGEDWSKVAKYLKILSLPSAIKDFLKNNRNDQAIVRFFCLDRLIEIVQLREEQVQMSRFREFMEWIKEETIFASQYG